MDPTIDSAACAQSLSVCNAALRNLSSSARRLQGDPCAASGGSHADALHIAAIFVVLVASAAGALIPLFSKHSTKYKISQYAIAVGKCTGTGVILSCALIHMLQPANASLTSPCVPTAFNTDYTSYAYLFALISALMMHYVDVSLGSWMETEAYVESAASVPLVGPARVEACGHSHGHVHHLEVTSHEETGSIAISTTTVPNGAHAALPSRDLTYGSISTKIGAAAVDASMPALARVPSIKMRALQQLASVYMIEFGITVHSVFIGLAAGVVGTDDLKALLVALSFHQFFEGVALGSRLSEVEVVSQSQEALLISVFSVAAPVGLSIGVGLSSVMDTNGSTFLLIQGSFDGVCAGLLLFLGCSLLIRDFGDDLKRHCSGKPREQLMRTGMFLALWSGAALMALIGRWL